MKIIENIKWNAAEKQATRYIDALADNDYERFQIASLSAWLNKQTWHEMQLTGGYSARQMKDVMQSYCVYSNIADEINRRNGNNWVF